MIEFSGREDEVRRVKFGEGRRDALVELLTKEHQAIESYRDAVKPTWERWVQQSQSRLVRKDAGPRDSKIDMSLTRERLNQSESRLVSPIVQADRIMMGTPRTSGERSHDLSLQVEDVCDYILDRGNVMDWASDWAEHFHVLPFGVIKTQFVHREIRYKKWEEIQDVPESMDAPGATKEEQYLELKSAGAKGVSKREFENGEIRYFQEIEDTRVEKSGVYPECIPPQDFLFKDAPSIEESEIVTHRTWQTRDMIEQKIKMKVYDSKTPEGDLIAEVLGEAPETSDNMFSISNKHKVDEEVNRRFDVRETYLAFAPDKKGGDQLEIIVTWEPTQKIIFRVIHNFNHSYCRPFVIHQFKHIVGSMYGIPATFDLEYPHRAYSASINQRLDAASKAQEVAVLLPPNHPMLKQGDRRSVRGGLYENPGYRREDIIEFKVSDSGFSQLPGLEQIFEHRADRVMHLPPATWGEESAQRPTATGTMAITEQSQFPQTLQLERFRKSFALVVKHMLARYRQFFPEGMRLYMQQEDQEGQQLTTEWFKWPAEAIEDDVLVQTTVSSATMSKMIRKQEIVALLDRMPQLYQGMYQMAEMASNPMNPAAMVAMKFLEGMRVTADMFFKEFDVGRRDTLNPELSGGIYEQNMQKLQGMVQQLEQQLQQMQQAGQGMQMELAQKNQELQSLQSGLAGNPAVVSRMG